MHRVYFLVKRALDGIKRRPALYVLTLITLAATFLSFATTLTAAINVDRLMQKWVGTAELTVYLKEGATEIELKKLTKALAEIPEVVNVDTMTEQAAKESFAVAMTGYEEMVRALPDSAFPASVDVHLKGNAAASMASRKALASRIEKVSMVESVDLYDSWYSKLIAIFTVSRAAAVGLGFLSLVVSILVVSATVRASVNARFKEIEVLELVGATRRYIRFPFQLEGALQTVAAMVLALVALHFVTDYMQSALQGAIPLIGLSGLVRLDNPLLMTLIIGSAGAGVIGAGLSLKKRHTV